MKKTLLLIAILFASFAYSQTTITLGAGTSGSATRGPFQRSSITSSSVFSRAVMHYSATELAPLSTSATISQVSFELGSSNVITATSGDATMVVYMRNSSATDVVPNSSDWATVLAGATMVGSYTFNLANNFPGSTGYMDFALSSVFSYTGGALEIFVDWDCSNLVPADPSVPNQLFSGNGSLNWRWDNTTHQSLNVQAGSSGAPSSLNNSKAERANTQIVYTVGAGGPTPPALGQIIGEFPTMDGGMENQVADNTLSSAGSSQGASMTPQTQWTVSSTGNSAVRDMTDDASLARTGAFSAAFQINTTASNLRLQSPSTLVPDALQTNTEYTIQFLYKASVDVGNDLDPGIYLNNSSGSNTTNKTDVPAFVADTWIKAYGTVTTGTDFNASHWAVARMSGSNQTEVRVDDFVVYSGTFDDVAPSAPTSGTFALESTGTIGWTAPASGVDGGGYVVVKYATAPNADNDPNQNGIYNVGNTTTNGTGGLTGTVVYIGTDTSFTDSSAVGSFYKVYAVDKAFNYSDELLVSDAALGVNENTVLEFKVYPNPVNDVLTIQSGNEAKIASVEVFDVLGKQIIKTQLQNNTLNVSELSKGIYLLKIISENGNQITKKIVVE